MDPSGDRGGDDLSGGAPRGEALSRIYRRRFPEEDRVAKARVWRAVVEGYLQRWIRATDTVLDLGCGDGAFLNAVSCARRLGVDLNPDARKHLAPGVELFEAEITALPFLPGSSVDLVFTSNVLEHLAGKADVERALSEALRVLKPGGHLVAMGPNLRAVPGAYWDFWDHRIPITDRALVEALELLGFEVADAIPRFLPYTTRSRYPKAPWLVRLYLALPLLWPLAGGQFLVRARKPG